MHSVPPYQDEELFQLLKRNNRKGFELLYKQEFITVFYFIRRFVSNHQVAEDITTETFLKLYARLEDFSNMTGIRTFLYRTAKNASLNYLRDNRRHEEHHEQLIYLLEQVNEDAYAEQQLTASIYQYIYEEIEKLSPQLKKVFIMAYIEDYSNEEISQELGINNQSVRNSKARALSQIRLAMIARKDYGLFLLWLTLKFSMN